MCDPPSGRSTLCSVWRAPIFARRTRRLLKERSISEKGARSRGSFAHARAARGLSTILTFAATLTLGTTLTLGATLTLATMMSFEIGRAHV